MPAKIAVTRTGRTPENLRRSASSYKLRDCRHRLRATALTIEDVLSRAEISRRAGVDAQTLREQFVRCNRSGIDGLRDAARPGRSPKLNESRTARLASWIDAGPDPETDEASRWTVAAVQEWIKRCFAADFTAEGVRRMLHRPGFRHVSPRPIHPETNPEAQKKFRDEFSESGWTVLPGNVSSEDVLMYFQDEARIGQKGMLSRIQARKGTRPRIRRDYRYGYVCLFPAACPETGNAVGHVCDKANTEEMNRHPQDVGRELPEGKHAVTALDGAGRHRSKDIEIPSNVSLLRLPPCGPELNPVETVFSVLKHRHFANRVFESAGHVRETVTQVQEDFTCETEEIMRITKRDQAKI